MARHMEVATTIRSQLLQSPIKMMSWGAREFMGGTSDGLPFLQFRVSGRKFQGKVRILLDPSDTYTVQFIRGETVKDVTTDVYCDVLAEVIDRRVETN